VVTCSDVTPPIASALTDRYGDGAPLPAELHQVWSEFVSLVYAKNPHWGVPKGVLEKRPSLQYDMANGAFGEYDRCALVRLWRGLIQEGKRNARLRKKRTFLHDITDWTRQVLCSMRAMRGSAASAERPVSTSA
jgi:hypothetical protein